MPRVGPFEALVYDPAVAGPVDLVTARPYDVISDARRARYEERSDVNIVRIDLPTDGDDPYAAAGDRLRRWVERGVLRPLEPGYLAYEIDHPWRGGRRRLRGVLVALWIEPWGGPIWPHEEVMAGPVDDRLRLLRATGTHLSPIYGTVEGPIEELAAALERVAGTQPLQEVRDVEDVVHRTWPMAPDTEVDRWLEGRPLLIADGHHRYTTALAYRDERRASSGPGPWDRVFAFVVDAGTQPVAVEPYHRVQVSGEPLAAGDLVDVDAAPRDDPPRILRVTREDDRLVTRVLEPPGPGPAVAALHRAGLDEAAPGDALRFTPDRDEALARVASGDAVAAYLLPATDPTTIATSIASGERLPRKSTFFWPKPRTGLALMPVHGQSGPAAGVTPAMPRPAPRAS
jgi:uncharacterized protein (DUF1015 family)